MERHKEAVSKAGFIWPTAKRRKLDTGQGGTSTAYRKQADQEEEEQKKSTGQGRQATNDAEKQQQQKEGSKVCTGVFGYS
jgi:type IV secretory pathway VirD2 relaxase